MSIMVIFTHTFFSLHHILYMRAASLSEKTASFHGAYMCKSTEICDETLKVLLKIFFRAHFRGQVFLVVCSMYKRNSRLYSVHQLVTFSRTTSYFLRKWQKKPFSSNLNYYAQKRSTQSFKKEIKPRKKEL